MAIFRARDVRQLSDVELSEQMEKLRMELIQHYGKVSAGVRQRTRAGSGSSAGRLPG